MTERTRKVDMTDASKGKLFSVEGGAFGIDKNLRVYVTAKRGRLQAPLFKKILFFTKSIFRLTKAASYAKMS